MEKNRMMQQNVYQTFCSFAFVTTRAILVLLLCGLSLTWTPLSAQEKRVTLQLKDTPLGDVVKALKKQTGKDFLFSNREVDVTRKVTVDVKEMALKEVLPLVFGKNFRFEISEDVVIVRPYAAAITGLVLKGIVLDERKQPLPGVTVKVAHTSLGTATNLKGVFALRLPMTKGELEFSFIGYETKRVSFNEQTKDTIRVILIEDVEKLDEVQVIAYGQQKKRTSVSAISSIKADDIKELPTHSLENLLQGHMAGVEVNNISGSPGGGGSIVAIRGYNSFFVEGEGGDRQYGTPLYVVDGVPMQAFTSPITGSNTLSDLDPSMIESIEVLKDAASAAIYGSRAGNGVILITTKKGRSGQSKFTANVSYSTSWLPKTPVQSGGRLERYHSLNGLWNAVKPYKNAEGKWVMPQSFQEVYDYPAGGATAPVYNYFWGTPVNGQNAHVLQDSLNPFYNNSTDWWKYAYRTASVYNANIQASGGTDAVRYMIGAGYYNEEGIMLNSAFQRVNVMTNVSANPTKRLRLENQLSLTYSDRSRGGKGQGGVKMEGISMNPMAQSSLLPGNDYMKDELLDDLNSIIEKNHSYSARYNLVVDYEIIKNMHLRISGGVDFNQQNQNVFTPSTAEKEYHWSKSQGDIARNLSLLNENLLTYNFNIAQNHNFDILLGLSFQKDQMFSNGGYGWKGPNDFIQYVQGQWGDQNGLVNTGNETVPNMVSAFKYTSDFQESRLNSYFGRLSYNYKEKYMFETTIRRDGSSVFGDQVRWATFPSVAVGWAFTRENFMRPLYWLSFGKIRASWGRSGQKFSQPYLAHGLMQSSGSSFLGTLGMEPSTAGGVINRKLSWETTDQYDIGLDISFLDYRIKLTADYYYRYTKGQLQKIALPGNILYSNEQWQNALGVSNEGIEFELTADILRETAVTWRMKLNASRNWNRFEKSSDGFDYHEAVLGKPLSHIKAYKTDGFYNTMEELPYYTRPEGKPEPLKVGDNDIFFPGTRRIVDLNGDGRINSSDMYYAASPLPIVYGGFANEFHWKQFDLNLFFNYSLGRHIVKIYDDMYFSPKANGGPLMMDVRKLNAWTGADSKRADYPQVSPYSSVGLKNLGQYDSDIENVSMIRLKQLTLGYNLEERYAKKVGLSGVRFFLTAENLFMLTNYSGLDPEIVDLLGSSAGIDFLSSYPLPRKFTIGLTINF